LTFPAPLWWGQPQKNKGRGRGKTKRLEKGKLKKSSGALQEKAGNSSHDIRTWGEWRLKFSKRSTNGQVTGSVSCAKTQKRKIYSQIYPFLDSLK